MALPLGVALEESVGLNLLFRLRGSRQGVRGGGDEAGLIRRQLLEAGDDPPNRGGLAGRYGRVERLGLDLGGLLMRAATAEDLVEHARSLRCRDEAPRA